MRHRPPNGDPMTPPDLSQLPTPDADALAHSARLADAIRAEMARRDGALPFDRFMELTLYAPGLGYYSAGARRFGPAGDFVTAPEISPMFGQCVAAQVAEILDRLGGGDVLELGAGSGALAADMLLELERLEALPNHYRILEVSGALKLEQRDTLKRRVAHLLDRIEWLERLPEPGMEGVIVGNEVADALPVSRFRIADGGVEEAWVVARGEGFGWAWRPASEAVAAGVAHLVAEVGALPTGYVSEIHTGFGPWIAGLAERLARGAMLLVDYGYPRSEYYRAERNEGTLRCHYRHRAHADPLILPGLQDITAHVDFTALAEAGMAAGLQVAGYTSQTYFLLGCGIDRLVAASDVDQTVAHLARMQQVKVLTLPGEMGERFQALALTRGVDGPLCGFGIGDLRHRL